MREVDVSPVPVSNDDVWQKIAALPMPAAPVAGADGASGNHLQFGAGGGAGGDSDLRPGYFRTDSGRVVRNASHGYQVLGDAPISNENPNKGQFGYIDGVIPYLQDNGNPNSYSIEAKGLLKFTAYPVDMPQHTRGLEGASTWAFDGEGNAFIRNKGALFAPQAPYKTPTLGELRSDAFWSGVTDSARALPGALATLGSYASAASGNPLLILDMLNASTQLYSDVEMNGFGGTANKTFTKATDFALSVSPLGLPYYMAHENYRAAGGTAFNLFTELAAPMVFKAGAKITDWGRNRISSFVDSVPGDFGQFPMPDGTSANWKALNAQETARNAINEVNATTATLERIESRFAGASREVGFIVESETGNILNIGRQPYNQSYDGFKLTPEQWATAKDNWVTHNHPSGNTLGIQDLASAVANNARGIRASTSTGTFELSFDHSFASAYRGDPGAVFGLIQAETNKVGLGIMTDIRNGTFAIPEGVTGLQYKGFLANEMWLRYANQTPGLQYTFTPRKSP
jgi:hypothetical protein